MDMKSRVIDSTMVYFTSPVAKIDSNALQTATSSINLCPPAEPSSYVANNVQTEPPQRCRNETRTNTGARSSELFDSALVDLLEPLEEDNSSRTVPESDYFAGDFTFYTNITPEEGNPDKISMMYSEESHKLYVKKDHSFNVTFLTSSLVPPGTKIRAMAVFTQPESMKEVVKRCFKHTYADHKNGVLAPDHFVRCESPQASYDRDSTSSRRSLLVPYDVSERNYYSPMSVAYSFKFICSGTCLGGLNGRPFKLIFTLENGDSVIGRDSIEVKICTNPRKEFETDDKKVASSQERAVPRTGKIDFPEKKRKFPMLDENENTISSQGDASAVGPFQIRVHDRDMYEFLLLTQRAYRLAKQLEKFSPQIMEYLKRCQKKKKRKGE